MNNTKIAVDKGFLSELKAGIIEAITSEDGLDRLNGQYLLSRLNNLLDLPEFIGTLFTEANKELAMTHQFYTREGNRWGPRRFRGL